MPAPQPAEVLHVAISSFSQAKAKPAMMAMISTAMTAPQRVPVPGVVMGISMKVRNHAMMGTSWRRMLALVVGTPAVAMVLCMRAARLATMAIHWTVMLVPVRAKSLDAVMESRKL
jgi:hypothetical protein